MQFGSHAFSACLARAIRGDVCRPVLRVSGRLVRGRPCTMRPLVVVWLRALCVGSLTMRPLDLLIACAIVVSARSRVARRALVDTVVCIAFGPRV